MNCTVNQEQLTIQSNYLGKNNTCLPQGCSKKKTLKAIEKCTIGKVALKSKVQLSPSTLMVAFYDSVEEESKELDRKKVILQERLASLAGRRKELGKNWTKLQNHMKQTKSEVESMQHRQKVARRKADTEEKVIAKHTEDIIGLTKEYNELFEKNGKLKEEIDRRKHFETFFEEACKKGLAQQINWGYGYMSPGNILVGRYNTLCLTKKETMKKHQQDLQEIQKLNQEMREASESHSASVSMCQNKLASLQRTLDKHLCLEGRRLDSTTKKQKRAAERCRVIDLSSRAIENLHERCIDRESTTTATTTTTSSSSSSSLGDSVLDQQLHDIKEYILNMEGIVNYCKENYDVR